MQPEPTTGWDIGGAHLKAAHRDAAGRVLAVVQLPCPLWLGLEQLQRAVAEAQAWLPAAQRHGITMTGELTDVFADRAEGVQRIVRTMRDAFPASRLRIYAGDAGFVKAEDAPRHASAIASANWHASGRYVATRCAAGLFVDIGSTTTDLAPLAGGRVHTVGYTDAERLVAAELVYTGVTRTPIMALARSVKYVGVVHPLMAELFATTADGTVMSTFFEPDDDGWRAWFAIHPAFKMSPGTTVTPLLPFDGHVDLFGTTGEGMVVSTFFEADGGWRAWFSIN